MQKESSDLLYVFTFLAITRNLYPLFGHLFAMFMCRVGCQSLPYISKAGALVAAVIFDIF